MDKYNDNYYHIIEDILRLIRPVVAISHFFGVTLDAAIFTFNCLIKSLANLSDDLLSRTLRIFESNKQINVLNIYHYRRLLYLLKITYLKIWELSYLI